MVDYCRPGHIYQTSSNYIVVLVFNEQEFYKLNIKCNLYYEREKAKATMEYKYVYILANIGFKLDLQWLILITASR